MINFEEINELKESVYGYTKRLQHVLTTINSEPIPEESKKKH